MTPNRLEAGLALGRNLISIPDAIEAAHDLRIQLDMEAGIVTLDKDGMAMAHRDGREMVFPTRPRQVYDITGRGRYGDECLGHVVGRRRADYDAAIRLANIAAGLEVEKLGVATLTRTELLADLTRSGSSSSRKTCSREILLAELQEKRAEGNRIAFTNGCFDILHKGHVEYLEEARAQADVLVVGLNSDASVRQLKGPTRPHNDQEARAVVLAGLQAVDFVTVFDEATPSVLIKAIRPDVLVKGADYQKSEVVGALPSSNRMAGAFTCALTQRLFHVEHSAEIGSGMTPASGRRNAPMNVAIFLPNWVGDAVMATPAIKALRRHFAGAHIVGILRPYIADVFAGSAWFDSLIHLDPKGIRSKRWPSVARELRRRHIDLAILFPNSFHSALTAWLGNCRERIGYALHGRSLLLTQSPAWECDSRGRRIPSPIVDAYNQLARTAGCERVDRRMELLYHGGGRSGGGPSLGREQLP